MSGNVEPVLAAIAGLGDRFGQLERRFGDLESTVTRLRVDVMERLDRQQDTLSRIELEHRFDIKENGA